MDVLLTTDDLLEITGMSRASLHRLVARGGIPVTRVYRRLRFRRGDVEQWIAEHTEPAR